MPPLSTRALSSFERLQEKSEFIVAAAQLASIACMLITYLATPASHADAAPLSSIPFGLSLFSILVLVRLYFAATHQLDRTFLATSTVLEMAILIFTLWSIHLQFERESAIVLKNPNFVYIFVLIALRALRFDPLLVLLSGATAAIGWALVVWHAMQQGGAQRITRDYITYISTDRILPTAELGKLLAIIGITLLLAYVVRRAADHLREAVGSGLAATDLSRFFDANVAARIRDAEEAPDAGRGELRHAVIMFIDLRGFTRASQHLTPDGLIQMLSSYQQRMVPIITAHHGSIDKFMGDGILVSFGATAPLADYAAHALRCMETIIADTHVWRAESAVVREQQLDVGMGIASGEVVFGTIGHAERLEYTVIGEPVNLAAKLEKFTKQLQARAAVLHETLLLAQAQGFAATRPCTTHHASRVEGAATPMDVASFS